MAATQQWLIAGVIALVAFPLAAWAGIAYGKRVARKYPGAAIALHVFMGFFKLDPPPPPKAERVTRNEEDAGDPPIT
jgi:hypothetical protein